MSEGLQTPDGKAIELAAAERTFAEAMSAPETDVPAPKKMSAAQKEQVKAEPKRTRTRRTPAEKARTAPVSQKVDKDYTEDIAGITTGVWLTAASLPPTQSYAALIKLNQPALVASLNQGAQNNSTVRGYVEKLSSGSGGMWMVSLGVTTANMAMQGLQLMRSPELRKQMAEQTQAELKQYLADAGIKPLETDAKETDTGVQAETPADR
jgi:hypothetical protein